MPACARARSSAVRPAAIASVIRCSSYVYRCRARGRRRRPRRCARRIARSSRLLRAARDDRAYQAEVREETAGERPSPIVQATRSAPLTDRWRVGSRGSPASRGAILLAPDGGATRAARARGARDGRPVRARPSAASRPRTWHLARRDPECARGRAGSAKRREAARTRAPPLAHARAASSGPKSQKYRNGVAAANSSPMNSIGTCGAQQQARRAPRACAAAGRRARAMRSPSARLPTWSCVCRNDDERGWRQVRDRLAARARRREAPKARPGRAKPSASARPSSAQRSVRRSRRSSRRARRSPARAARGARRRSIARLRSRASAGGSRCEQRASLRVVLQHQVHVALAARPAAHRARAISSARCGGRVGRGSRARRRGAGRRSGTPRSSTARCG